MVNWIIKEVEVCTGGLGHGSNKEFVQKKMEKEMYKYRLANLFWEGITIYNK